jgi:tripartite-type tricarboxylate transporter receptor subunit TctC
MTHGSSIRRGWIAAAMMTAALLMTLASAAPLAQGYPGKVVRYVVPFPAGGSPDIIARLIAERLGRIWGQQVIVDNRAGAGGTVGAQLAAKAPADGYTLFQCNVASSAIAEALQPRRGYDHQRDFAPISRIGMTPNVLIVHPSLPFRSTQDFIAYARRHPGELSYGTSGVGTSQHLTMEFLKLTARIQVVHVAYKGAAQSMSDVTGGQIPASVQSAPAVLPSIQAGRLRALGVTSLRRIPQLPAVPTMHETALPGFEVNSWWGVCAPAGTPPAVLERIHPDLVAVLRQPDLQQKLRDMVIEVTPSTPAELGAFIRTEAARWARVVKEAGIPQQ